MNYRKLRIAWSVACGIVAVSLILLSMRSQHTWDNYYGPLFGRGLVLTSRNVGIAIGVPDHAPTQWSIKHAVATERITQDYSYSLGFGINRAMPAVFFPLWFTVAVCITFGAIPWITKQSWRFSIRTVLIATTLVAMVLGLIVYAEG